MNCDTSNAGVLSGDIRIVKYLYHKCDKSPDACRSAVIGGHLEILQWLCDNGYVYDESLCDEAVENNQIEIRRYLYKKGLRCTSDSMYNHAAKNGYFEILKWLHENNCPRSLAAYKYAVVNGHLDIAKWLWDNGLFNRQ